MTNETTRFSPGRKRIFWAVFWLFLFTVGVAGGASRADAASQVLVRVMAVAMIALPALLDWPMQPRFRAAFLFAGAVAALLILQLIPLPPSVWTALPGRDVYAQGALLAGLEQPWRPWTLSPDGTLNALLALLAPVAALVGLMYLGPDARNRVLMALLALVLVSALLGAAQMAAGPDSGLRFYRITNRSSAVGLFANRNHQAALLAMGIPLAIWWLSAADSPVKTLGARVGVGVAAFLLIAVALVTSGSRAGLGVALFAGLCAIPFLLHSRPPAKLVAALAAGGAALAALALFSFNRLQGLERLSSESVGEDLRFQLLPDFTTLFWTYFPAGAGFGTFANIYRRIERPEMLGPGYMNHVHLDWLELAIEGGLPALLLLALFLVWWLVATVRIWRQPLGRALRDGQGRIGTILTGTLLLASLVDYPLRTPLMAALFAIGCALMIHTLAGLRRAPVPAG